MTDTTTLIQRLSDEADLCRNDGATDVAKLLDDAVYALVNQAARLAAAEIVSAQPAAPAEPKGADGLPVSAPRLYADEEPPEPAAHADATEDELLDLEQALERRRILEEIKKVAEVHPADDMPTPFQSAWQQCCEEIFYRATEGQWHMDEDASRFAKNHAAPEPRQPMSACPHGVPHRWSCGECDTGVEMLAPADAAPSVAPEPNAWMWQHDETGRTGFVDGGFDRAHWEEHNPRLKIIAPCFAYPPRAPLTDAEIDAMWQVAYPDLCDEPRCSFDWFEAGVRALEARISAHGIGGK